MFLVSKSAIESGFQGPNFDLVEFHMEKAMRVQSFIGRDPKLTYGE